MFDSPLKAIFSFFSQFIYMILENLSIILGYKFEKDRHTVGLGLLDSGFLKILSSIGFQSVQDQKKEEKVRKKGKENGKKRKKHNEKRRKTKRKTENEDKKEQKE